MSKINLPEGLDGNDLIEKMESVIGEKMPDGLRAFILKNAKQPKITKTYSLRSKWQPLLDDMLKAVDESKIADGKVETKKTIFWRTVEADLNQFKFGMMYNQKTNEIEQTDEAKHSDL